MTVLIKAITGVCGIAAAEAGILRCAYLFGKLGVSPSAALHGEVVMELAAWILLGAVSMTWLTVTQKEEAKP